ncbi:MAG: hypothetical protein JNK82_19990 [Myxococcaceae bacterium]|nr:hypothetical protein [Myxococcaceae bacterium]
MPQGNSLNAMWAASPDEVWAAGDVGTVMRFSSGVWSLYDTPTRNDLYAIAGASPTDVWAAGSAGVMMHFDGTSWTSVQAGATDWVQLAVSSATRVAALDGNGAVALNLGTGTFVRVTSPLTLKHLASAGADLFAATSTGAYRLDANRWEPLDAGLSGQEAVLDLEGVGTSLALLTNAGLREWRGGGGFGAPRATPDAGFVFGNARQLWLGASTGLWRVTDGGLRFVSTASPAAAAVAVNDEAWVAGRGGYLAMTYEGGLRSSSFSATSVGSTFSQLDVTALAAAGPHVAAGTSAEGIDAGGSWLVRETLGPGLWELRHCVPRFGAVEDRAIKSLIVRADGRALGVLASNHIGRFALDATQCEYGTTGATHVASTADFGTILWATFDQYAYSFNDTLPTTDLGAPPWSSDDVEGVGALGSRFFVATRSGRLFTSANPDGGWLALAAGAPLVPAFATLAVSPLQELWAVGEGGELVRALASLSVIGPTPAVARQVRASAFWGDSLYVFEQGGDVHVFAPDGGRERSSTPARALTCAASSDAGLWVGGANGALLKRQ